MSETQAATPHKQPPLAVQRMQWSNDLIAAGVMAATAFGAVLAAAVLTVVKLAQARREAAARAE